ncbi:MAG: hypothetical protein UR28_C0007G0021 [Candidatus Peregrinibacteria bacterium GW2011_GWF2_33_10]|nr:MAG: hypothetical protein UR28_C0007G0021 [Candidatus Peregrinibacteria bacterium GW2011_GWF2_33_10]
MVNILVTILNALQNQNIYTLLCYTALVYLILVFIAVIFWTVRDVCNRSQSILFKSFSILLVLFFNIFGFLIYIIIRPQKTLNELALEQSELEILKKYKKHRQLKKKL